MRMLSKVEKALIELVGEDFRQKSYLIAVSGGADSMALVHLFQSLSLQIHIAHVNYQLRGKDSDLDEGLVKSYCTENAIEYSVQSPKTPLNQSKSIQDEARAFRYQFFEELSNQFKLDFIVTAHHLNDDIETSLINFARGSGLKGLKGIPARRGNIIRPLLQVSKNEILDYVSKNEIPYRDDKSNFSDHYQRNFIRLNVLDPWLKKDDRAIQGMQLSLEHLKNYHRMMRRLVSQLEDKEQNCGKWKELKLDDLLQEDVEIQREYLRSKGLSASQTDDLLASIDKQSVGASFETPTGELVLNRNEIQFGSLSESVQFYIEKEDQSKHGLHFERVLKDQVNFEPGVLYLDYEKLVFPLEVRSWKEGDKFQPLGMKGKQLISDFMINQKLSLMEKKRVQVILSKGLIVGVVGHRISELFKIGETTEKVYIVRGN